MALGALHHRILLKMQHSFLLTMRTRTSYMSPGFQYLMNGVWYRQYTYRWSTMLTLTVRLPYFLFRVSKLPGGYSELSP